MFQEGVTVKRSDFPIWGPLSKPLKFGVHYQNHSNLGSIIKTTQIWGPLSKPLKFGADDQNHSNLSKATFIN